MRFEHTIVRDDIMREFPECIFVFKEYPSSMDMIIKNEDGNDIVIHLAEKMTLHFDRWHEDYALRDEEYERLLWDIKDIVNNTAFAMSVTVGDHLYVSQLMRIMINGVDDLVNDDPAEYSGLYKTGAIIECVYYENKRSKKYVIEKGN